MTHFFMPIFQGYVYHTKDLFFMHFRKCFSFFKELPTFQVSYPHVFTYLSTKFCLWNIEFHTSSTLSTASSTNVLKCVHCIKNICLIDIKLFFTQFSNLGLHLILNQLHAGTASDNTLRYQSLQRYRYKGLAVGNKVSRPLVFQGLP